eukprot:459886-Hanusia_phi.AAC.2
MPCRPGREAREAELSSCVDLILCCWSARGGKVADIGGGVSCGGSAERDEEGGRRHLCLQPDRQPRHGQVVADT